MGRHKKHEYERRDTEIKIRFTLMEAAYLQDEAEAAGVPRAAYIRMRCLKQRIVTPKLRGVDPALIVEINNLSMQLAAIGNNVNQIARNMNADRRQAPGWERVPEVLREIVKKTSRTLDQLVLHDPEDPRQG